MIKSYISQVNHVFYNIMGELEDVSQTAENFLYA